MKKYELKVKQEEDTSHVFYQLKVDKNLGLDELKKAKAIKPKVDESEKKFLLLSARTKVNSHHYTKT
jgi:hypothetical protein